ncbi:hypothetical protein ACFL6U_31675, partial [Planctomycetota bacterium]
DTNYRLIKKRLSATGTNYVDGFRGLKLIGYRGAISFEGGWPKDPVNPKKGLPEEERIRLIRNMVKMLKEQWEMA